MTEIKVEVKRSGFPVRIGLTDLWFDTSQERLLQYFDFEEELNQRINEYQKKIVDSALDSQVESNGVTKETAAGALDLEKEYLRIQYDLIFEDGTFDLLYAQYPDLQALTNTFETVAGLIQTKLEELAIEREDVIKTKTKAYSKKSKIAKIK